MTVGYGDMYPKSHIRRFVGIISCFWGFFIISVFVVTMNNILNFSISEEGSYTLLKRLEFKDQIKDRAARVLGSAFKYKGTVCGCAQLKDLSGLDIPEAKGSLVG
jgi:hypothetical protein